MKRIVREDDGNTFEVDTKWTQIVKFIKNDWRELPSVFCYIVAIIFGILFYWVPTAMHSIIVRYIEIIKFNKMLKHTYPMNFSSDEETKETKRELNYSEFSNAFLTGVAVVSLLVICGLIWLVDYFIL